MNKLRSRRFLLIFGLLLLLYTVSAAIWVLSPVQRSLAQTTLASNTNSNVPRQSALVSEYLNGMKKLRSGGLTSAQREKLAGQMADVRQRLKDFRKQMRVSSGALPFGPPPSGTEALPANTAENVQSAATCESCKYVLNEIAYDVGTGITLQAVQASFEQTCAKAQKAPIFYSTCEDMYDDLYAITGDYIYTPGPRGVKVCQMANLCPTK